MGKFGNSRRSTAQSTTHGSTRRPRGDGRLDPVRWRRPGRGTLIRLLAVAALLATAAAVSWSPPPSCSTRPAGQVRTSAPPSAPDPAHPHIASSADQARASPTAQNPDAGAPSGSAGLPSAGAGVPSGSVGVPIRLADPAALSLVRPGNRVDLLRLDDTGGRPAAVATAALVLRVINPDDPATGALLLALSPQQAEQAVATPHQAYAIVIRPG